MELTVLTVKQLNTYVRSLLESDTNLMMVNIVGEISNLRQYSSGHIYFSLKEDNSIIKAVLFSNTLYNNRIDFNFNEGDRVVVSGKVTIYEKDGSYQIICNNIYKEGVGKETENFKEIYNRLKQKGLFLEENKKNIPEFPEKIGIVTSADGAALHDINSVISRRYPFCELFVFHTLVQGAEAPKLIIKALNEADGLGLDLIIIARGGGSKEDLSAFNNEDLALSIFNAKTPIISAIGHEVDFTICDFVADRRAETPSAAAEMAVPNILDIENSLAELKSKIRFGFFGFIKNKEKTLDFYKNLNVFKNPETLYVNLERKLNEEEKNLKISYKNILNGFSNKISVNSANLEALSPLKVLTRGYSIVYKNNKIINEKTELCENDRITVKRADENIIFNATKIVREKIK